jgi:inner membrane protein
VKPRILAQVDEQAQRLHHIVEQMLELSKLESLRALPAKAPVDLHAADAAGRVRRVHPIQYALVGLALSLFFLLLLSLSEHLPFATAYAAASTACVVLLGFYARHMLGRPLDGWLFGGGMALLYGLLYLLLLREQTALVLGSLGLFAALALVMVLTRRVDWYRLGGREARGEPRAA